MLDRQRQEAGDYSQQIQAQTVIVQGITEERVKECAIAIFNERMEAVIRGYSLEAHDIVNQRINNFANDLIPKLVKADMIDALKDPSIQILLAEAQKTAAATERVPDYELLSELLIHRVSKGEDRNSRAGISRAVEIVDKISDEALLALTVLHTAIRIHSPFGSVYAGLDTLDQIFGKIITNVCP